MKEYAPNLRSAYTIIYSMYANWRQFNEKVTRYDTVNEPVSYNIE